MSFAFNPFTGTFDIVNGDNFSYNKILASTTLIIPLNQQMIVHGRLKIEGRLIIKGRLTII